MLVHEVMVREVHTVAPDASVDEAAQTMADLDVGALPVSRDGRRVEGIVTDRDILIRVVAQGRDPRATRVAQAMSSNVFTCTPEESVDDAMRAMEAHQIRRLPVLDAEGKMIGLVSLADLGGAAGAPRERTAQPG